MKHNSLLFCFALVSLLLLTSCNKKGDPGPTGPVGPAGSFLSGDLIGYCYADNQYGPLPVDNSGITVTAEGSGVFARTDSSGRFILNNLHTGTYTISYSKSGYGTWKSQGFQFVGGGQALIGSAYIYKLPDYNVLNLKASTDSIGYLDIKGTFSKSISAYYPNYVLLFFSKSSDVSSDPNHYLFTNQFYLNSQGITFQYDLPTYYLSNQGLTRGQTLYVIAYGASNSNSYLDISTGKYVYPNISTNSSNVTSFIVP